MSELSRMYRHLDCMADMEDEELFEFLGLDRSGKHKDIWDNIVKRMQGVNVNSLYRPIYPLLLINHKMQGRTFVSFCAVIGVGQSVLYLWNKTREDFKAAKEIGDGFMRYKWETIALESAQGFNKGNAATIIFALKNFFPDDFKDKREVEHSGHSYVIDTGIQRQGATELPINAEYSVKDTSVKQVEQDGSGSVGHFNPMDSLGDMDETKSVEDNLEGWL